MDQSPISCSFLTLNLFSDLPTFRHLDRRLEIAAAAIAQTRPGIVALQEIVRARQSGDMGAKLCALVNRLCGGQHYQLHYAAADGLGEDEWKFEEGIALMSRYEIAGEIEVFKYPSQVRITASVGNQEYRLPDDRVAMHARYLIDRGVEVDAYGTHLTDRNEEQDGVGIRVLQSRELLQWIERTSGPDNLVLAGGDFNDLPESATIRTLTAGGLIDLHAAAGDGPGFTNDRGDLDIEGRQASPNQRIDYIFLRPPRERKYRIDSIRLIVDHPSAEPDEKWLWASDHFGVLARLSLG